MATKVVYVSDLTGTRADKQDLARLVVQWHPALAEPVTLDVLRDEITRLPVINDVIWADYYPPGSSIRHRLTIPQPAFDALATEREMDAVLRIALLTAHFRRALDPQPGRRGAETCPRCR